jgi:L-lactate dehydrogenase complex protein LldG
MAKQPQFNSQFKDAEWHQALPETITKEEEVMFDSFKTKAVAQGNTEVVRFGTKAEALGFLLEFMQKEGIADAAGSYAVWADCPFLKGIDKNELAAKVSGLTFEVTPQKAKEAKIGITQMDWGVANTGTLAQDSTKAAQRLASALPWIHVMLLGTDKIVADLPSLLTKVHPSQSNYIALITGPSKTADIERVLAIGVHGPERVLIVCVDELGGMN